MDAVASPFLPVFAVCGLRILSSEAAWSTGGAFGVAGLDVGSGGVLDDGFVVSVVGVVVVGVVGVVGSAVGFGLTRLRDPRERNMRGRIRGFGSDCDGWDSERGQCAGFRCRGCCYCCLPSALRESGVVGVRRSSWRKLIGFCTSSAHKPAIRTGC